MNKLVISKKDKAALSKAQLAFNRLTARIEKLRAGIAKAETQYDLALDMYAKDIYPRQQKVAAGERIVFDLLWAIYKKEKLSGPDRRTLKETLQEQLYRILRETEGAPEESLQDIFAELEGESYEAVLKREQEAERDDLRDMFASMNVDVDLEGAETEAEIAARVAEAQHKVREASEKQQEEWQARQQQRKTPKQQQKEELQKAAAAHEQKNVSTIYRQLAKLFHPDLEQDPGAKAEKEMLMKELTTAYETGNLHALLMLELKWIHQETDHLTTLTDEKLAVYIQILKKQAAELQQEHARVIMRPRYSILLQVLGAQAIAEPLRTVKVRLAELDRDLLVLRQDAVDYGGADAVKHVRRFLAQLRREARMEADDIDGMNDLLAIFFEGDQRSGKQGKKRR